MTDKFIGCQIQLDCGLVGSFSGIVTDVTSEKITLKEALRNGEPCNSSTITLHKSSLQNISIISLPDAKPTNKSAPVPAVDARKEKIKHIPNTTAAYICPTNPVLPVKKKPSDFAQQSSGSTNIPGTDILHDLFKFQPMNNSSPRHRHSNSFSSYGNGNNQNQQRGRGTNNNNSSTFSVHPQDIHIQGEFDFEGNLAMFDKKAFYEEVDSGRTEKPDLVRTTEPKLRHDENVLGATSKTGKTGISVPCRTTEEYTTDDSVTVPAITEELRVAVLSAAEKSGFSGLRVAEVFGRNAADFLIQQMGGAQRLRPENAHQLPQVGCIIGTGRRGLMGLSLARHLANRDIGVTVYVTSPGSAELTTELELFKNTGCAVVFNLRELPWLLDFIVLATSEILTPDDPIAEWCHRNRAPTAALCPTQRNPGQLHCKLNLQYILPVPVDHSYGTVCLCESGFSKKMFQQVGITYSNPFGHRSAVQLRPR